MTSIGRLNPMRPVEQTSTSSASQPISWAVSSHIRIASAIPRLPVAALALPLLSTTAVAEPRAARCWRETTTGAAVSLLEVKTPATASGCQTAAAPSEPPCSFAVLLLASLLSPPLLSPPLLLPPLLPPSLSPPPAFTSLLSTARSSGPDPSDPAPPSPCLASPSLMPQWMPAAAKPATSVTLMDTPPQPTALCLQATRRRG